MGVGPQDDPEWVRSEVRRLGLHGLKCYHVNAPVPRTWDADIPDYLPERLVKVADEEGWVITLHMVKSRAVADPGNIRWIRRYCETYPNMKLILAHSARGFQPAHNLEGLPKLTGLDNLYFDTSANCEPIAHEAIIRIIGHKKLMYGSDFTVSHLRGRSVGAADSFLWLYEESPVWGEKHTQIKPVLIGLEHLRSLKWACWSARLSDKEVEDIFWNNAAGLFGIR
jgi:glutamate-1-semialdehyde 2,1-aminomutase